MNDFFKDYSKQWKDDSDGQMKIYLTEKELKSELRKHFDEESSQNAIDAIKDGQVIQTNWAYFKRETFSHGEFKK